MRSIAAKFIDELVWHPRLLTPQFSNLIFEVNQYRNITYFMEWHYTLSLQTA